MGIDARHKVGDSTEGRTELLYQQLGNLLEMRTPLKRLATRIDQRNPISMPHTIPAAPGIAPRDPVSGLFGAALEELITPKNQARLRIVTECLRTMPRTPRETR